MTGALGLEKLLDFSIILVKPFSIVPRREAAFLLSSYLEMVFSCKHRCSRSVLRKGSSSFCSSLSEFLFKLNFSRQQLVGVKLLDFCPSFSHSGLDVESDFGLNQLVVCVAVSTGHDSGMYHIRSSWHTRT